MTTFFTGTITTNGAGDGSNSTCYFGFTGSSVQVRVNGVTSNTLTL